MEKWQKWARRKQTAKQRSDGGCRASPSTRGKSALVFPNTGVREHQLRLTEGGPSGESLDNKDDKSNVHMETQWYDEH